MVKHTLLVLMRYLVLLLVVSAIVLAMLTVLRKPSGNSYTSPPPAVITAQPSTGVIRSGPTVYGYLEPRAVIPVVPLAAGTIVSFTASQGDKVAKGQVLAAIDDAPYRQQQAQAQAALDAASSAFDRIEQLHTTGGASNQTLEQARAQRDAAAAQLELARLQLGHTSIEAPINGIVLSTSADTGDIASSTSPIAIIADVTALEISLDLPESWYDRIMAAQGNLYAEVVRTSGDKTAATAAVRSIAPYIDAASKTFAVACVLEDYPATWIPGMHVRVLVVTDTWGPGPVLLQADRTIEGDAFIYDEESGTARLVRIEGTAEDSVYLAVPDQFAQTWFIVEGQNTVFDGQTVTVVGTYGE